MEKRSRDMEISYDPTVDYVHTNVYGQERCYVPGCQYYHDHKVADDDGAPYRLCPRHYQRLQRMIGRSLAPVKVRRFLAACKKRPL